MKRILMIGIAIAVVSLTGAAVVSGQTTSNRPRGGSGFSDRGVSGFLPGQYSNRRTEIHEKAKT